MTVEPPRLRDPAGARSETRAAAARGYGPVQDRRRAIVVAHGRADAGRRRRFASACAERQRLPASASPLRGSLAWTGKGHATDQAVILGLAGEWPDTIDPDTSETIVDRIRREKTVGGLAFDPATDLVFDYGPPLGRHPNALTFTAEDGAGASIVAETWYSVGGGFIEREGATSGEEAAAYEPVQPLRHRVATARCGALHRPILVAGLARQRGTAPGRRRTRSPFLDRIVAIMMACMDRGLERDGVLPGGLRVRRRASAIHARLTATSHRNHKLPHEIMDHVSTFAMAVNEENAAGWPHGHRADQRRRRRHSAVLRYHRDFCEGTAADARRMLLTASLIGDLVKRNASISGAEVGCQGRSARPRRWRRRASASCSAARRSRCGQRRRDRARAPSRD